MLTIFKYKLHEVLHANTLEIPLVRPLKVDYQNGEPFLWAVVDPNREKRAIIVVRAGTGQPLDGDIPLCNYLNTTVAPSEPYVWHWFWKEV